MYKRAYSNSVFSDKRLEARFDKVCSQLSACLSGSVPKATLSWGDTKSIYRFWSNKRVSVERQLSHHLTQVWNKISQQGLGGPILQLSDTVELDYTGKKGSSKLGPLNFLRQRGLRLHNSLFVNCLGQPLGILKQSFEIRKEEDWGKKEERSKGPIEKKESYRWLSHFQAGQDFCRNHPSQQVIYVADREADMTALFVKQRVDNMHFVVRSNYDRQLYKSKEKLSTMIDKCEVAGTYTLQVVHAVTKKMRQAHIKVRFCPVQFAPPERSKSPTQLYVVDIKEINAKVEPDQIVHWRLLTSLPVLNFEQAMLIVQYYIWRWLIERFHFLLKSGGANVEQLQLATSERLKNAITTYSIAAMEAFTLRYLAEKTPDQSIYDVGISPVEHQVLYEYAQKRIQLKVNFDPLNPPTVREYCIVLGQITGFFPSKKQPIPGLVILTRSIEKLNLLVDAYITFSQRTE